jgi:hypothetical protein
MSPAFPDARAAEAADQARRLRAAAAAIRRLSRGLRYHPSIGQRPQPSPDLLSALEEIAQVVEDVRRGADGRAGEERALVEAAGDAVEAAGDAVEAVRAGHAAVEKGAEVTLAALSALRGLFQRLDEASLDAPYGRGAPTRHHPGALCTMVAERAESLALALETVTIRKANLQRALGAQTAAAGH